MISTDDKTKECGLEVENAGDIQSKRPLVRYEGQLIGYKDKNGDEIRVGDNLQYHHPGDEYEEEGLCRVELVPMVVWHDGMSTRRQELDDRMIGGERDVPEARRIVRSVDFPGDKWLDGIERLLANTQDG